MNQLDLLKYQRPERVRRPDRCARRLKAGRYRPPERSPLDSRNYASEPSLSGDERPVVRSASSYRDELAALYARKR